MNRITELKMVDSTNIPVREESDGAISGGGTIMSPGTNNKSGIAIPLKKQIIANLIPILKALVIVTLFLLDGIGFSPLGCKTQYLMSRRFWFNKQIVIFFVIYFIINLGGDTISKLTDPIQQVVVSIGCLFFYNVVARLGGIWWNKDPWYWPGPMTWFGAICLPLIVVYILDDMRRYYIAENAILANANTIDSIRHVEIGVISIVLAITCIGFIRAMNMAKKIHGKYYSFLAFFFGIEMGTAKTGKIEVCDQKRFNKIKKEIKLGAEKRHISNKHIIKTFGGIFSVISFALILGYVIIDKNIFINVLNTFKNKLYGVQNQAVLG